MAALRAAPASNEAAFRRLWSMLGSMPPQQDKRPEPKWLLLAVIISIAVLGVVLWMIVKLWHG